MWLDMATAKIIAYRQEKRERRAAHKEMDKVEPKQMEIA